MQSTKISQLKIRLTFNLDIIKTKLKDHVPPRTKITKTDSGHIIFPRKTGHFIIGGDFNMESTQYGTTSIETQMEHMSETIQP